MIVDQKQLEHFQTALVAQLTEELNSLKQQIIVIEDRIKQLQETQIGTCDYCGARHVPIVPTHVAYDVRQWSCANGCDGQ
jgi:CHAT domain-containing protein